MCSFRWQNTIDKTLSSLHKKKLLIIIAIEESKGFNTFSLGLFRPIDKRRDNKTVNSN